MKTTNLFILMFLIGALMPIDSSGQVWKQRCKKNGLFYLEGGINNPKLDLAEKKIGNKSAGFAKNGFSLGVNYIFKTSDMFGYTLSLNYMNNPLDIEEISKKYAGMGSLESKNISTVGAFFGGYFTPLPYNLSIGFRALVGAMFSHRPDMFYYNGAEKIKITAHSSVAPAVKIGTAVKLNLIDETLGIIFNIDYVYAKQNFKEVSTIYEVATANNNSFDYKQNNAFLMFNMGIGFIIE